MESMNSTIAWMTDPLIALYQRLAALAPNLVGCPGAALSWLRDGQTRRGLVRRLLARLGVDRLAESSGLAALPAMGFERPLSALVGTRCLCSSCWPSPFPPPMPWG